MISKEMKEDVAGIKDGKPVTGLWALLNMVGGVSGLLSLLMVAIMGGKLMKQVEIDSKRIDNIEQGGSPTLKSTITALNLEIESRKESDILNNKRVDDLRTDFLARIGAITTLLERQIEQQTALIALIKAQQQTTK